MLFTIAKFCLGWQPRPPHAPLVLHHLSCSFVSRKHSQQSCFVASSPPSEHSSMFGNASKYPKKYKIIPEVIKFCLNSEFFKNMSTWMKEHQKAFGGQEVKVFEGSAGFEHKLEYTLLYEKFKTEFEEKLEAFIASHGSSTLKFFELCKTCVEHGDDNTKAFIDILDQTTSYETFLEIAKDNQKREYFFQVMNQYAKSLKVNTSWW